ncbi:MAG: cation transporter [Acidobacteria bacterium]|nr:cation transporter [Acidobacteriota bacterium]
MKRIAVVTVLLAVTAVLAGLFGPEAAGVHEEQTVLKIEGMTCGGCAVSVKAVVKKIDGVHDAKVDWKKGRAIVTFDPERVTAEQIARTIQEKLTYETEVLDEGNDSD